MTLHHGDCLEVMAGMEPESVDAIVTDPPYGIGFMGKEWDDLATAPNEARWNKRDRNLDVVKSGRGTTGTTFADPNPRCAKCGKVRHGTPKHVCQCGDDWSPAPRENRQAQRSQQWHQQWAEAAYRVAKPSAYLLAFGGTRTVHRMTVALEDAGWIIRDMLVWVYLSGFPKSRASLKPSYEPIVLARKPGPLRDLDIEGCRIHSEPHDTSRDGEASASTRYTDEGGTNIAALPGPRGGDELGRWPANVVMVEPALGDASRVFLIPKADRADREPVQRPILRANVHPTVKPTDLMRHLVRLVTPSGGVVLDPFLGSGTTALAAEMEGFAWIGIEREAEYVAIAEARLNGVQKGLGLDVPAPIPRLPNTHPDLSKHQPKQRAPGENWSGRWAGTPEEEPA